MATRGIIAEPTKDGWRGRYSHWDNNPERMVSVLRSLVARDGIETVRQTLIHDYASWSVIDAEQSGSDPMSDYHDHSLIEGYGRIHTDVDKSDPTLWFTSNDRDDLAWAEWLYILHNDRVEVRHILAGGNGIGIRTVANSMYAWVDSHETV